MKRGMILAGMMLLAGCATPLPGSESVVLTGNNDVVRGCAMLGQVDADQLLYGGPQGRDDVRQQLRNAAVKANATHVLMLNQPNLAGGFSSASGELYRCQS